MAPTRVFLDFTVAEAPLGRVVFELFSDVVPTTAENFRALCTGEKRNAAGLQLAYKGSPVHRVIEGFMIQGGDFTKRNGSGGESIYGGMFADERLEGDGTEVDREGLLVMANRGPNTNGSQWFITLAAAPHLTGKHVVFGRVVSGMEHIRAIGQLSTDERDRPHSPVIVSHAGELELRRPPPRAPSRSRSRSPRRRSYSKAEESDDEEDRRRRRERRARKEKEREDREERRRERRERQERKRRGDGEEKEGRERHRRSVSETISELDARLEREEQARLEKERAAKLEELKSQVERDRQATMDAGGVVYKGRGAMRYRDPESRPANYNPRGHDTRARYHGDRGGGRWERGEELREDRDDRGGRGWGGDRMRGRDGGREGGRRWDADRWERSAPTFERASDRWDAGRMGDGADAAREAIGGLAARLSARRKEGGDAMEGGEVGLDYGVGEARAVEVDRELERDGGRGGRNARAAAWAAARRSQSPQRVSRSQSPRKARSPSPRRERDREERSLSAGSDMVMDRDD